MKILYATIIKKKYIINGKINNLDLIHLFDDDNLF